MSPDRSGQKALRSGEPPFAALGHEVAVRRQSVPTMPADYGRPVVHRVEVTKEKEKYHDRNHYQGPTAAQNLD
jgi:hypothetical protein